jgi:hypothetical protein
LPPPDGLAQQTVNDTALKLVLLARLGPPDERRRLEGGAGRVRRMHLAQPGEEDLRGCEPAAVDEILAGAQLRRGGDVLRRDGSGGQGEGEEWRR